MQAEKIRASRKSLFSSAKFSKAAIRPEDQIEPSPEASWDPLGMMNGGLTLNTVRTGRRAFGISFVWKEKWGFQEKCFQTNSTSSSALPLRGCFIWQGDVDWLSRCIWSWPSALLVPHQQRPWHRQTPSWAKDLPQQLLYSSNYTAFFKEGCRHTHASLCVSHSFTNPWITSLFQQAYYLLCSHKLHWQRQPKSRQVWNT